MENLGQLNIIIHVVAGGGMLLFAPAAFLINVKNIQRHRLAGKIFNYCMAIVGITTLFGVLKDPTNIFRQFLLAILIFTVYSVVKGVRAIQIMKGSEVKKIDYINIGFLGAAGVFLIGAAIWLYFSGKFGLTGPILFGVFGFLSIIEIRPALKLLKVGRDDKNELFRQHIGSMMGAFIASCTAFTVNAFHDLPTLIQWFGPTIILVPLVVYYTNKFAPKKKAA